MSRAPWEADHQLTPEQFVRILERRFPEFSDPDVRSLRHGWDYLTFLVDDDWTFKVPKRAAVVTRMRQEVSLLTALPPMPAAVPRPSFHGVAADDIPYPFFGYPYLDGLPACSPGVDPQPVIGSILAFLDRLHTIDPPFAVEGWPDGTWEQRLGRLRRVRTSMPELGPALAWLSHHEPRSTQRRLLHGDLAPEHILLHPTDHAVVAVLDWADAALGDPARDLAALLHWQPTITATLHRERGGSEEELQRALAHALMDGLLRLEEQLRWAPEQTAEQVHTLLALQRAALSG